MVKEVSQGKARMNDEDKLEVVMYLQDLATEFFEKIYLEDNTKEELIELRDQINGAKEVLIYYKNL